MLSPPPPHHNPPSSALPSHTLTTKTRGSSTCIDGCCGARGWCRRRSVQGRQGRAHKTRNLTFGPNLDEGFSFSRVFGTGSVRDPSEGFTLALFPHSLFCQAGESRDFGLNPRFVHPIARASFVCALGPPQPPDDSIFQTPATEDSSLGKRNAESLERD